MVHFDRFRATSAKIAQSLCVSSGSPANCSKFRSQNSWALETLGHCRPVLGQHLPQRNFRRRHSEARKRKSNQTGSVPVAPTAICGPSLLQTRQTNRIELPQCWLIAGRFPPNPIPRQPWPIPLRPWLEWAKFGASASKLGRIRPMHERRNAQTHRHHTVHKSPNSRSAHKRPHVKSRYPVRSPGWRWS